MAKKVNPLEDNYIAPGLARMLYELEHGKPIGEHAGIDSMAGTFSWKRGFVNCFTGNPNDGKSTLFLFLALVMSVKKGWKWLIWSPEMMTSFFNSKTGKVEIVADEIYDELIYMMTGKCTNKHFNDLYKIPMITLKEYKEAFDFITQHFIVIYPNDVKYTDLKDNFYYFHDLYKVDGILIDPYKNIDQEEEQGRSDQHMDKVFKTFKRCALETNTSLNIIAHPRGQIEPKNPNGTYKICTQFMLAGGASWNNNMDGIFSVYRPNKHDKLTDPSVHLYTLKQRKQQLVGRVGVCEDIEFDFFKNRYYFGGICPIDGSAIEQRASSSTPKQEKKKAQSGIEFKNTLMNFAESARVATDDEEVPF